MGYMSAGEGAVCCGNDTGQCVLYTLQPLDIILAHTVKDEVDVVDSCTNESELVSD